MPRKYTPTGNPRGRPKKAATPQEEAQRRLQRQARGHPKGVTVWDVMLDRCATLATSEDPDASLRGQMMLWRWTRPEDKEGEPPPSIVPWGEAKHRQGSIVPWNDPSAGMTYRDPPAAPPAPPVDVDSLPLPWSLPTAGGLPTVGPQPRPLPEENTPGAHADDPEGDAALEILAAALRAARGELPRLAPLRQPVCGNPGADPGPWRNPQVRLARLREDRRWEAERRGW